MNNWPLSFFKAFSIILSDCCYNNWVTKKINNSHASTNLFIIDFSLTTFHPNFLHLNNALISLNIRRGPNLKLNICVLIQFQSLCDTSNFSAIIFWALNTDRQKSSVTAYYVSYWSSVYDRHKSWNFSSLQNKKKIADAIIISILKTF